MSLLRVAGELTPNRETDRALRRGSQGLDERAIKKAEIGGLSFGDQPRTGRAQRVAEKQPERDLRPEWFSSRSTPASSRLSTCARSMARRFNTQS